MNDGKGAIHVEEKIEAVGKGGALDGEGGLGVSEQREEERDEAAAKHFGHLIARSRRMVAMAGAVLAVLDACLDIGVGGLDEAGERGGIDRGSGPQLHMTHELAGSLATGGLDPGALRRERSRRSCGT